MRRARGLLNARGLPAAARVEAADPSTYLPPHTQTPCKQPQLHEYLTDDWRAAPPLGRQHCKIAQRECDECAFLVAHPKRLQGAVFLGGPDGEATCPHSLLCL